MADILVDRIFKIFTTLLEVENGGLRNVKGVIFKLHVAHSELFFNTFAFLTILLNAEIEFGPHRLVRLSRILVNLHYGINGQSLIDFHDTLSSRAFNGCALPGIFSFGPFQIDSLFLLKAKANFFYVQF